MKHIKTSRWRTVAKRYGSIVGASVFAVLFMILLIRKILAQGMLVYGDIPYFKASTSINFLYSWSPAQLGTSARQGLNTLRDAILMRILPTSALFYYAKYYMPIFLILVSYYFCLGKFGVKNRYIRSFCALLPLASPVFFGDFLNGQTMWVYPVLPWVIYYLFLICYHHQFTIRNGITLALLCFLLMGMLPPLIVPLLVTLLVLGFLSLIATFSTAEPKILLQYLKIGTVTGLAFILLTFPYIFVASSGQQAFTSPSLLADYYHNYSKTTLLNNLRLAGNAGNGQNTLDYNENTIFNMFGYCYVAIIVIAFLLERRLGTFGERKMVAVLFAALLGGLGFLHVMSVSPAFGERVFQSQWIVSTIRNPSKLYTIYLPLMIIAFALAFEYLYEHTRTYRFQRTMVSLIMIMLIFYGWPILRGDFGLFYKKNDRIASYRPDNTVNHIAEEANKTAKGRSLLIPANHRDELNYEYISPSLNTSKLEGGFAQSTNLNKEIKANFATQNPHFFNYLVSAGISDVFVKKDPKSYSTAPFLLFGSPFPPGEAKSFLETRMKLTSETPDYYQFSHQANPLIYSAQKVVSIEDTKDLKAKAPFIEQRDVAVITAKTRIPQERLNIYKWTRDVPKNQIIPDGIVQLFDPTIVLVEQAITSPSRNQRTLQLSVVDPLTNARQAILTKPLQPQEEVLATDDSYETLRNEPKTRALRAGSYIIKAGKLRAINLRDIDGGFEAQNQFVGDASRNRQGKADVYSKTVDTAAEGKHAMLLGTNGHLALTGRELPISGSGKTYRVSFQYKPLAGTSLSYSILQNETTLATSNGPLDKGSEWMRVESYIHPQKGTGKVNIYFYSEFQNERSENLIDDLRLDVVEERTITNINIPAYKPDTPVKNYTPTQPIFETSNLLNNASFETPQLWGAVGDATASLNGNAKVKASQSNDSTNGKHSLELRSSNHTGFVKQQVLRFVPNGIYKLSFDYRNVKGEIPAFAIWQSGVKLSKPSGLLKSPNNSWQHYETYFIPERDTTSLALYLYTPSKGKESINLFDNVSITRSSYISNYLIASQTTESTPDEFVKGFTRINPTIVQVNASGSGVLIFNESFHKGWRAFIVPNNRALSPLQKTLIVPPGKSISADNHFTANGFANGWWIDPKDVPQGGYKIILEYWPQRKMFLGLIVSALTFIPCILYLIYDWLAKGRKRHIYTPWSGKKS